MALETKTREAAKPRNPKPFLLLETGQTEPPAGISSPESPSLSSSPILTNLHPPAHKTRSSSLSQPATFVFLFIFPRCTTISNAGQRPAARSSSAPCRTETRASRPLLLPRSVHLPQPEAFTGAHGLSPHSSRPPSGQTSSSGASVSNHQQTLQQPVLLQFKPG